MSAKDDESVGHQRESGGVQPPVHLSVIISVYNEVALIKTAIERVASSPVQEEIIIVDDGSTDGTREFLQTLSRLPGLKVLERVSKPVLSGYQGKTSVVP